MSLERVVAGTYALLRPIGRGPGSVVYVARDRDERLVALKLVPARPGVDRAAIARLLADLRAPAERTHHAGIAAVLDAGYDEGSIFIVTELLHGESLRDLMQERTPIDALEYALTPLSIAHAQGLVHRDLTPANVFVARARSGEERVTLLDFGLVRHLLGHGVAAPGIGLGDPAYMAPEQLDGSGRATPATDVWAFGVMLYEAVAGHLPFGDARAEARATRIREQPHAPLDAVADVSPATARLVDLCLEKDPARRPRDARALMRLMKAMRGLPAGMDAPAHVMKDTVIDPAGSAPEPPPSELDEALRRAPRDPEVHRALLAFYREREVMDGVWLAASALEQLGAADERELRLFHHYRRPPAMGHDRGLDANAWAALVHPDQDPRVDAVWSAIADALLSMHRRPDEVVGLDRATKLDVGRPTDPLARTFALAVGALRTGALPRLYRGPAGVAPQHAPTVPAASVFPLDFEEPLPLGALVFAVGRHVAYYRSAHRVCALLHEPDALERVFEGAVSLGLGRADTKMARLLDEHLSGDGRDALRIACVRLGGAAPRVDLGTWRRAVELSACRAGALLAADLGGAAWMLRWLRERRRIPQRDAQADLLGFWSSGAHVRLRHQLGLAVKR